ncbi:lactonase family protein [Nocardia sp. NPDC004068]|uniref:lactonase family protein n=1 Tax=Nocardia sp. NPDC004068 TaxID=3364303 RepID=UPI00369191B1
MRTFDRRKHRHARAGWALIAAAAVLPGFLAAAQPAAADAPGYHIYAHGYLSDGVVGFNATDTGQPVRVAGRAPTGQPDWPQGASPNGRFFYSAPTMNPRLIPYAIGSDGTLTPGTPLPLPDVPVDIAFAPNERDGYVLVGAVNAAIVPVRFGGDGTPIANGPAVSLGLMGGLGTASVSPDGRNLYVASVPDRQLLVFDIHGDGTLSPVKQRLSGGINPLFPTLTPDGRHLFITNELSATVQAFNRADDGTLTEVAGSPYPSGILPHVSSVTPDGRYLYVPNMGTAAINAYAIQDDGTLRPLPGTDFDPAVGVYSESTVMSPSGKVLWALGTDPMRGGEEVLRRFIIGADGVLVRDDSVALYPGTTIADGRTLTLVPNT